MNVPNEANERIINYQIMINERYDNVCQNKLLFLKKAYCLLPQNSLLFTALDSHHINECITMN